MALNKKQKKQIDVLRKKIQGLQQQLAGAKKQPDDPAEIPRLEKEIEACKAQIATIEKEG
ncbi:MAG: hypothetical protein KDA80_13195 [Planctomycetaceae bacterium]|nr:hypothetical protein [Planctomycetaceae bacterium]